MGISARSNLLITSWVSLKYATEVYQYDENVCVESWTYPTYLWNCCRYYDVSSTWYSFVLPSERNSSLDWNADYSWRNIRLYGNRIGRVHDFFRGIEAKEARKPRLEILGVEKYGDFIRVKIVNIGGSVARGVYGRITINNTREDICQTGVPTFIGSTRESYMQVDKAGLCWSISGNPFKINIPKGRIPETLDILKLGRASHIPSGFGNVAGVDVPLHFEIPSEEGWGRQAEHAGGGTVMTKEAKKSRISILAKTYTGKLIIGADDVEPVERDFTLGYNSETGEAYLELRA